MKRDSQLREAAEMEKAELERRRNMTDEQRLEEDKKLGIGIFKSKEKAKWNFMQRYYHKVLIVIVSTKGALITCHSGLT